MDRTGIICRGLNEIRWIEQYLFKKGYAWWWFEEYYPKTDKLRPVSETIVIYVDPSKKLSYDVLEDNVANKNIEAKTILRKEKLKRIK